MVNYEVGDVTQVVSGIIEWKIGAKRALYVHMHIHVKFFLFFLAVALSAFEGDL